MQKQLAPKGPDGLSDTCHAPVWILHFCTFFCSFSCKRKIFLGKTFYHENLQVQAVSLVYHIMSWCDLFYFFIFCKLWLQIVCKNDFSQWKDLYQVNLQVKPVQMTYRMCLYLRYLVNFRVEGGKAWWALVHSTHKLHNERYVNKIYAQIRIFK